MADPTTLLALASTATLGITVAAAAGLKAWQEWLEIRRLEIENGRGRRFAGGSSELGQLRQRVRRLESIADGDA